MEAERRITHRLVNYWQQIKEDRLLPDEREIDADDIQDMWDNCFIIQVRYHVDHGQLLGHHYSYVGRAIEEIYFNKNEGGHLFSLEPAKLANFFSEMLMTKLPIVENVENAQFAGRSVKYRHCLLPLGDAEGKITGVFGGIRFKYD